jgi:D-alanine transaminase
MLIRQYADTLTNQYAINMTRISYINGNFLPHEEAKIHMEDRGYVFSDGVYEVALIKNGVFIDWQEHCERLQYSLDGLRIEFKVSAVELEKTVRELLAKNNMQEAVLYLQITRGVAKRDHQFPSPPPKPAVAMMLSPFNPPPAEQYASGIKAITLPDLRWKRRDYKTISLLPNTLAKQQAVEAGAGEAILIEEDGCITEGSATNFFIVDKAGNVRTHPISHRILGGITRMGVLQFARANGINVIEKPFAKDELFSASEAFITSTTKHILPVTMVDGKNIGDGKVGPVTTKLVELYKQYIAQIVA